MIHRILCVIISIAFFQCSEVSSVDPIEFENSYDKVFTLLEKDLDSAMLVVDNTLELATEHNIVAEVMYAHYMKGYIYDELDDLPNALMSYLHALKILEKTSDKSLRARHIDVLHDIGNIFGKSYKYTNAIAYYDRGLELATNEDDQSRMLMLMYSKAYDLLQLKRTTESIELLKDACNLSNRYADTTMLLKCFNLLGVIHKENSFFTAAREYYQYILESPSATARDRARALHNTAVAYLKEENIGQSKFYLEKSLSLKRKIRDKKILFTTLHDLAEWHLKYGSLDSAWRHAINAEQLYPSLFSEPETFKVFRLLSDIADRKGDADVSKAYANRAYDESILFHESTQEIMKQKDMFQIDLILAGFKAEQEAHKQQARAQLNQWILLLVMISVGVAAVGLRLWFRWWRDGLWQKINVLMQRYPNRN